MKGLHIGPFQLQSALAVGGMGEVWSAVHVHSGLPVAIKFIRRDRFKDGEEKESFEKEVQSQARLDHPGIVYLYDYGELTPDAALSLGAPAGAPWLAMELCSSSLQEISRTIKWNGLQRVLVQLLEALAHAHSMGILHRDIKLANILIATDKDARPGVKLADFGIAHALADDDETTRTVGTPRYMAPEQVNGAWESLGPWTDLYAFGVLVWRVVTGQRPWGNRTGSRLVMSMLHKQLGREEARFDVPPGLWDWIEKLTEKDPSSRYQLAADALVDLRLLPDLQTPYGIFDSSQTLIPSDVEEIPAPRAPVVAPIDDPPIDAEASIRMSEAGLGLLHLRRPAYIGRRSERRFAWECLRRVSLAGRPEGISVVGPARIGRTRFIEWIGEAAHRTGQAGVVQVECVPGQDVGSAFVTALRAWFRVGPLDPPQAKKQLQSWLGEADWLDALVQTLHHGPGPEWMTLVSHTLARLGRRRPLVVLIKGAEGVRSVHPLVKTVEALEVAPILFATDTVLPGFVVMKLGPMQDNVMARLADALYLLDSDVRARLISRAAGNPGLLVQTLTHWAKRGKLREISAGDRPSREEVALPPTIVIVAKTRLNAVLAQLVEPQILALERAAIIGDVVDMELWAAVDGYGRAGVRQRVVQVLSARGLCGESPVGWTFTSVPFREAILERIGDRCASLHRECAQALQRQGEVGDPLALGKHLLASGDAEHALPPLYRGILRLNEREGAVVAFASLHSLERAVDALGSEEQPRWRVLVDALLAKLHTENGELRRAEIFADAALQRAETVGSDPLRSRCWACFGAIAERRGRPFSSIRMYAKARSLCSDDDHGACARLSMEVAKVHLALGDRERWCAAMNDAARDAALDVRRTIPHLPLIGQAVTQQVNGDPSSALELLEAAYAAAREDGSKGGCLTVLRCRAHTLADMGRLGEAREVFLRALELSLTVRISRSPVLLANAVALDLELFEIQAARERFERHRFLVPPGQDTRANQTSAHCAALAVRCEQQDNRSARYHLNRIRVGGAWGWASIRSGLVLLRFAARAARVHGFVDLSEQIIAAGLSATDGVRRHTGRELLRREACRPTRSSRSE